MSSLYIPYLAGLEVLAGLTLSLVLVVNKQKGTHLERE